MSSTPLLNDIKATYEKAFLPPNTSSAKSHHHNSNSSHIRNGAFDNRLSPAARDDARRQLEEHLSLLCTSILIGGEQFVREFPSALYVPVLTDILIAAHATPAAGTGDGVNPLIWDLQEESVTSMAKPSKQQPQQHRGKDKSSAAASSIHYAGFQMASPVELLATRALALIAGDVPRGSYAMRTSKSPQTIPVLAAYLGDADFLVINDELTEELLKCFLYFTLIAHETCVEANVPRRIVELLLVVEQHHLRVLCVQVLSNMLARAREAELEEVWSPVLALFVESLSDFIANSPFQSGAPAPSPSPSLPQRSSATWPDSVSSPSGSPLRLAPAPLPAGPRTVTAKERTLLMHYLESLVHALDRLFVDVAAMECHVRLLEHFVEICVQLLRTSVHISPVEDRWAVRALALSPLTTLYLISPTFAVPLLLRLRVWEAVCGCMLAAVERKQLEPVGPRMAGPIPPGATAGAGREAGVGQAVANPDNDDLNGAARASGAASSTASASSAPATAALAAPSASSNTPAAAAGEEEEDISGSATAPQDAASAPANTTSITSGPVLTTDVMTIPYISDEQELLPLLEFLLILTPCARRGHSHCDYRNTTGPYFRWTWEDDFHNEMECNEALCRRLERTYQLTRHFRTHGRYAMTHGKQRVFYADFLSKMYLSDRKQRHSLHRRPLLAGYVHDSRNAFLHGCTCCAAEPEPLFTTWANRSIMQLRTADAASTSAAATSHASDDAAAAATATSHHRRHRHSNSNNDSQADYPRDEGNSRGDEEDNAAGADSVGGSDATVGQRDLARSSSAPSLRAAGANSRSVTDRATQSGSPNSRSGHPALNALQGGGDVGARASGSGQAEAAASATAASETSSESSRGRHGSQHRHSHRNHTHSHHRHRSPNQLQPQRSSSSQSHHTRTSANRSRRQVAFQDRSAGGGNDNTAQDPHRAMDADNADGADRDGEVEEEDEDMLNDDFDSTAEGSRSGVRRGGFSLCSCGGSSDSATAANRAVGQQLRLRGGVAADGASTQSQKRALVTVTLLPLEAMLEDPMEKLQTDPATRTAFLGKEVLSRLVPTMLPALLSLMDNCVNPLVTRHSMTLLLRCLSLCADLRTQVTGEPIEVPVTNTGSSTTAPGAAAATSTTTASLARTSGKEKGSSKRFLSFRKWITGNSSGGGTTAPRWQRAEWQNTQTALQCFVPALRDLFVGLYLMEGIHIVAGRQDVFAAMKDDLLMADELARIHIAPEFCSFQLSVPSEQLTTSADAMVLLMGLFPRATPARALPPAPPTGTSSSTSKTVGKGPKKSSFRKPSLPLAHTAPAPAGSSTSAGAVQELPVKSFTSFVKTSRETRHNEASTLSPLPPLPAGFPNDVGALLELETPAAMATAEARESAEGMNASGFHGGRSSLHASPSPLLASVTSALYEAGDGEPAHSSLSASTAARASTSALAESSIKAGKVPRPPVASSSPENHASNSSDKKRMSSSTGSNTAPLGSSGGVGAGVFTLHQATLLLNYARQIMHRGPRVCAAAMHIEQTMQQTEFKSMVVLGSSEADATATGNAAATATATTQLRTKELTLRTSPAASCPFHFSFSHCTENFFEASAALYQALWKESGDLLMEAACSPPASAATTPTNAANAARAMMTTTGYTADPAARLNNHCLSNRDADGGGESRPEEATAESSTDAPERDGNDGRRDRADPSHPSPLSRAAIEEEASAGHQSGATTPTAAGVSEAPSPATAAAAAAVAATAGTEGDLPIDVKVSVVPKTISLRDIWRVLQLKINDTASPYYALPQPLRIVLLFYDYCKERDIELRAVFVEVPDFVSAIAEALWSWYNTSTRQREDAEFIGTRFSALPGDDEATETSSTSGDGGRLRLNSASRGKILQLVSELGATVSRDLGFATVNLDPSIIVKQPCSFVKRAKRMKTFGAVRHLAWRPLTLTFDSVTGPLTSTMSSNNRSKPGEGESKTQERQLVVLVNGVALPVVSGATLRKSTMSVLPNTSMGTLATALAKQVQLPLPTTPSPRTSSSPRRLGGASGAAVPAAGGTLTSAATATATTTATAAAAAAAQRSPAAVALHAVQERQPTHELLASPVLLTESSPCLTSEEFFEDANSSSSALRAVSPDRILLFVNGVPMLSPLTTVLDALTAYAVTGVSLRRLVTTPPQTAESGDAHRNRVQLTLPTLPFWVCKHEVKFVVLQDPLPTELLIGASPTSLWETGRGRRCCCSHMEPPFFCSPRHLYEIAPERSAMALYSILSQIARNDLTDEASVLDSSQRRLSSAVVHQLYQHLSMFMLPPLLYCSGIGAARLGTPIDVIASTTRADAAMTFPTASCALWRFPSMFAMDMRVSILRFFISAQRSLSFEQCRHILQSHQSLLVRRAAGEPNFGAEEGRNVGSVVHHSTTSHSRNAGQAEGTDRRLDVVGLEWLSEEVLRRRRVTLTVDRRHILQSAEQLFTLATCTFTLDVAFKGEAGIGPGPAMEFYELVVEELLKPKHGLFRTEEIPQEEGNIDSAAREDKTGSGGFGASATALRGRRSCNPLYPAARQTAQSLHYWELLGLLLGRLLMMGETSAISFHPLLLRRLIGERLLTTATEPVRSYLELLDPTLYASLRRLIKMAPAELEACELYFTIPLSEADNCVVGRDVELPMHEDGAARRVTFENLDEYIDRLESYYLQYVPDLALLHLRRGLQYTVNPTYLELFSDVELSRLFGSAQDAKVWESREQFARCIEAGHGYHKRSDVVQYLLDVVPQWSAQLQHRFLKFVTGSSCVPYGGLTQAIKVVRRDIDPATAADATTMTNQVSHSFAADGGGAGGPNGTLVSGSAVLSTTHNNHSFGLNTAYDHTLPTVSTCFLYLKLPQYSSRAVLEERLRFAVCEGSNFFALT